MTGAIPSLTCLKKSGQEGTFWCPLPGRLQRLLAEGRVLEMPEQTERVRGREDQCPAGIARRTPPCEFDDVHLCQGTASASGSREVESEFSSSKARVL